MNLILDVIPKKDQEDFCEYIIKELSELVLNKYDKDRAKLIEEYINNSNIIKQRINKKEYYSVYNLYRLALEALEFKLTKKDVYQIKVNNKIVIPNSYTNLYSIISLLEFGTLSVRKYGLLSECMEVITDNLTTYYIKYLGAK